MESDKRHHAPDTHADQTLDPLCTQPSNRTISHDTVEQIDRPPDSSLDDTNTRPSDSSLIQRTKTIDDSTRQKSDSFSYAKTAAVKTLPSEPACPAQNSVTLQPGTVIRQYELIRELGRGGMGRVFLARDTKLARRVAIKFLTTRGGRQAEQLVAEARTTARCKHENIVIIYDVDEFRDYPYMVLEYLEGPTLGAWLDGRLPPTSAQQNDAGPTDRHRAHIPVSAERAVEIMVPVVRALLHAHKSGIVHRDLKPDNIVLTDDGPIKVLDFGIAKLFSSSEEIDERLVQSGERDPRLLDLVKDSTDVMVGTMPYMSPEQWGTDDVDHRTDIWAVGIILYELVTGHHPLMPLTQRALMTVPDETAPMPSLSDILAGPEIGPLAAIVDRCLLKRKSDRISSATELLKRLEPLLPGRRVAEKTNEANEAMSPFSGLAVFQESDSQRFFGRERDIAAMATRLRHQPLLALTGPSGAGKSSFVRAGLIPALKRSGDDWESITIRPGRYPLGALAGVIRLASSERGTRAPTHVAAERDAHAIDILRSQPGYLGAELRARCRQKLGRIVLFVDQFEELYTLSSTDERMAFIACLEGVADDAASPLRVIVALRSDFLDRMADDRETMRDIMRGLVFLPSMGRDSVRDALVKPVERAGYGFDSEALIEEMLDTLNSTRSPLPLLQFAASRLWDVRDRERRLLTRIEYDRLGGLAGALSTHADAVLAGLSAREQSLARRIFLRLVTPERTRAVVGIDELRTLSDENQIIETVIEHLANARLLLTETGEQEGATVELIHESLIASWPRLGRWLDENQEDAAFHARLQAAAKQWHASGRPQGLLWRERAADEARQWLTRQRTKPLSTPLTTADPDLALGSIERHYLRAVVGLAERSRQWRRRAIFGIIGSLGVIALVVSYLAIGANRAATRADRAASRADREAAVAQSQAERARNATRMATARELQTDPTIALAIVREIEPSMQPRGWATFARWALYADVARSVFVHDSVVKSVSPSPDGTRVATGSMDEVVRIWKAGDTGPPLELRGHERAVNTVAFSPDGRQVLSASNDGTARIWNADGTGQPRVISGLGHPVLCAAFSRDGTRVVMGSQERDVLVWNADGSGEPVVLRGHQGMVYHAAFSADGTRVISGSFDGSARIWNADGAGDAIVLDHDAFVFWADFSPDGTRVITGSQDRMARLWNADGTGSPVRLVGHDAPVSSVSFSPDGATIMTASHDGTVRLWRADGTGPIRILKAHETLVYATAFTADGARIVTASADYSARLWDTHPSAEALVLKGHKGTVYAAEFSADGKRVVSASVDRTARVWNADGSGEPVVLAGHDALLTSAGFSPDGNRVVSGAADNTVRLWNADGSGRPTILRGHDNFVASVAFSPDGKYIVSTSGDRTARIWRADGTGTPVVLRGHTAYVVSARFSPDNQRVVTGGYDNTARIWNADGTNQPIVLRGHDHWINSVEFSPDGTRVVTGSDDKTARVWRADGTGQPMILRGHDGALGARFSPDGQSVLTFSLDKTIRIWSLDGRGPPVILRGHDDEVRYAAYSPDGTRVVSAASDDTVRIWRDLGRLDRDDPRLWTATTYCMSAARRKQLFDIPAELAQANHAQCIRRVRDGLAQR